MTHDNFLILMGVIATSVCAHNFCHHLKASSPIEYKIAGVKVGRYPKTYPIRNKLKSLERDRETGIMPLCLPAVMSYGTIWSLVMHIYEDSIY